MGLMDKATDAASEHPDKVDSGIDKGSDYADDKTGGKHTDQIDSAGDKARDSLGGDGSKESAAKNDAGQASE
ncbi:MAG: antitoxin [Ornithinimicrobium sp.]